ncbi:hypothetical protein Zmor_001018 [Zophobas morio]|uniref:Crossover junction endonuclease EME1 n=1 Tax=Zophobas morio TaxID=2755281 RepID=A0AA38MR74_9CUCU|nr:hypothetical protein Zmor_001018 [Zophobas morio]
MNDFLEVSSDSSDTIILSPKDNFLPEQLDNEDSDVEALVNKYISENALKNLSEDTVVVEEQFDHEDSSVPRTKRLKTSNENEFSNNRSLSSSSSSQEDITNEAETLQVLQDKYKLTAVKEYAKNDVILKENVKPVNNKDLKKQEKELHKQERIREREQKKKEAEQEKIIKQSLAAAYKNVKPTECMKFITVGIDECISTQEYNNEIINALQEAGVQYRIQSQIFPNTINWTRKTQSHFLNDDGKLVLNSQDQSANEILLIMNCKKFVEHVSGDTLSGYIQSLQSVLDNKTITLAIYGLQSYFRFLKIRNQRERRAQLTDEQQKQTTSKIFFDDYPKVTKETIDYKLTELQLLCSCSHRLIESASDMGLLVTQFTKAVAEVPFKLQRYEKFQQTEWFVAGDNRDCVKVDKNGNGLNRLWKQMLTTFPLARLETAEAITSQYPTVSSLITAYQNSESTKAAESLLQDIPIRRAAGPLTSTRKIGPELSKKIWNFFTSTDGNTQL